MRDLAFALLRILSIGYLGLIALPGAFSTLLFFPYYLEDGEEVPFLVQSLISLTVSILVPLLIFVFARPIARIAVPDRALSSVSIDGSIITRAAFTVGGIALLVAGARGIFPIIARSFEWASAVAKHHDLVRAPNYHVYLQDAGELILGVAFLLIARRAK